MLHIKNNNYLLAAKWISAFVSSISTWNVFTEVFAKAGNHWILTYSLALGSILLIDGLYLATLSILEHPDISARDKLPWVVVAIALVVSIIGIGFVDEDFNPLSVAPRLGLIGLTLAYISMWANQRHQEQTSRDAIEKNINDSRVLMRRKMQQKAEERAYQDIQPDLQIKALVTAYDSMNLDEAWDRFYEIEQKHHKQRQQTTPEPATNNNGHNAKFTVDTLGEGIVSLDNGNYGWVNKNGEVVEHTAQGTPYTSVHGARIARGRALNN